MKKFAIIICVLFLNDSKIAFSEEGVKGLGLTSCKTFYNAKPEDKLIYISWMAGYITSHNLIKKKVHAKNVSYNRSQIWVEYFCYQNPNTSFRKAVDEFIREFTK